MNIRQIKAETVTQTVKQLFLDCNYFIGKDIMTALENARENEKSEVGKSVLTQIIENDKLAAKEEVPLCQDTGMAILFVEYGDKVVIEDGSFEDAVNEGVRQAYKDGYLRKSVVNDPVFDRLNTKDNTPAMNHTKNVSGDKIKITAGGKGFGSENMSAIKMITPSYGIDGVKKFILDTVRTAGPNPCPPIVVGVGIGAVIHNWIPESWIEAVLGGNNPFGVVLATLVGIPMYADIFGTIPVAEALLYKGAQLGTILSFMMAVTTLSLPSLIMLRKAVKPKLLALFIGICTIGIILVGYLFNAFQFLLI